MSEKSGHATSGLGARIGALRVAAGWSQPELARRAGVTKGTISKLEGGKTADPDARTKRGLVHAFGWSDWDTLVTSRDLTPPARPASAPAPLPPQTLESLLARQAGLFDVLLGVRRDVRILLGGGVTAGPAPPGDGGRPLPASRGATATAPGAALRKWLLAFYLG